MTLINNVLHVIEIIMLAGALLLGAYDIFVVLGVFKTQSLSGQVWDVSRKNSVIPFLVGFVCGHLFFSRIC